MKLKTFLIIAITLFFFGCNTEKSQLNGTWELISFKAVTDGETSWEIPKNATAQQLKSWSDNTFLFVGKFETDKQVNDNFGSGTYTLNGTHYEEHIKIHSGKSYIGETVKILMEIKGDTLIQINPVKDDWTVDKNNCRIEKYIRVK